LLARTVFSGSRRPPRLEQLAVATLARGGSPREAVGFVTASACEARR
jgi:hypothetical protein